MAGLAYRCIITAPGGTVLDVSRFLEIGKMGSVNIAPESDLATMTHGDFAMDLDNSTGEIEDFFEGADPSDIYDVVLSRERRDGTGWDRMFGGVLDLPYSLSYDDMAKTAHVVAFSYSKQMERTPADTIKRTLAYKTASITISTSTLVFIAGETADLEVGDVVRLTNTSGQYEEFTVDRIISTTQVATVDPAGRTFTSAFALVVTPFYHAYSPSALLTLIADESGLDLNDRNLGDALADFPIATPISDAGLNLTGSPSSLMPVSGSLTATFDAAYGTKRKATTGPTAAWTDGATSNRPQLDWTQFDSVQPTILDSWNGVTAFPDTGRYAPNYDDGFVYYLDTVAATMHLYQWTGAVENDLGVAMASGAPSATTVSVEYKTVHVKVFFSYRSGALRGLRYWKAGAFTTVSTTISGEIRNVQYGTDDVLVMVDDENNDLVFWEGSVGAGGSPSHTIVWGYPNDKILSWTMRSWGDGPGAGKIWFTFLFERDGSTHIAVFNAKGSYADWTLITTYRVSSFLSPTTSNYPSDLVYRATAFQTVITLPNGDEAAVGFAGGQWFVLSTAYAGVIRYANFDGSSCAKAARDIAVILGASVDVDRFKTLTIVNRKTLAEGDAVTDIGVPLSSTRYPVSDLYRAAVRVSGTDSAGSAINETQGDAGDSARRLDVDSDLVTTPGMALACAIVTLAFVEQIREQRNVTVTDDGTLLSPFDRVLLGGRPYVIYKMSTDLEQGTHELTLLEILP